MNFEFTEQQKQIYDLVGHLAREHFAPRAAAYDRDCALPLENLRDLHEHGLLGLTIGKQFGGLGSGVMGDDPLLYLLAIEQVARVDMASAHCLHIHLHAAHLIDQVCTPAQREEMLRPVLERGALLAATGSEPGRTARGMYALQASADRIDDGYALNGIKNYATLASVAEFTIVFVTLRGLAPPEGHLGVAIPRGTQGCAVIPGSWRPLGMRSAVSPTLTLDNCFVRERYAIGAPGIYARERWQARHYLSLSAQYLGACEGVFDALTRYLPQRGTVGEPSTQLRLGEVRVLIDSMRWLIYRAAWLWTRDDEPRAELFSLVAKQHALASATQVMDKAAQIAGSSAFMEDGPLERFERDLRIHVLHSNQDKTAATIGKYHLGQAFDTSDRL